MSSLLDKELRQLKSLNKQMTDQWAERIEQTVKSLRDRVVIPYCKKHSFTFLAGHFYESNGELFVPGESYHFSKKPQYDAGWYQERHYWLRPPTDEDTALQRVLDFRFDIDGVCLREQMERYRGEEVDE